MKGEWWVDPDELDKDQRRIIKLPPDGNHLITGPPGSGKTNLLLLRANYLYLKGFHNLAIVTFTRTLREFLASGGTQYDFPVDKIYTLNQWQFDLLRQYDKEVDPPKGFEDRRAFLADEVIRLMRSLGLQNVYECILLDEAQDYTEKELKAFSQLAARLFCVADDNQRIYRSDVSLDDLHKVADEHHQLQYHYRNGVKICRVADELGSARKGYVALEPTCQYNEDTRPSSVDVCQCANFGEQVRLILDRVEDQLRAYPKELIGIASPIRERVADLWSAIQGSGYESISVLHGGNTHLEFRRSTRICVATFHAMKGLEFRALHLAGADQVKNFALQRNIIFTASTRAKTSLSIYHSSSLPGYVEGALVAADMPGADPAVAIEDVFGGSR